jgi:hypothetical protein
MELLIIIVAIGLGIYSISWMVAKCQKASLYDEMKPRLDTLDVYNRKLDQRDQSLNKRHLIKEAKGAS